MIAIVGRRFVIVTVGRDEGGDRRVRGRAALRVARGHGDAEPEPEVGQPDAVRLAGRADHVRARCDIGVAALPL